jgi:hypothetical protein
MIDSAEELVPRVVALLGDTAELHTAAGIGFVSSSSSVSTRAAQVLATPSWHLLDARAAAAGDAAALRTRLEAALAQPRPVVMLVDGQTPPMALRVARAFADRQHGGPSVVDLGDRQEGTIGATQSLVVVVDGIGAHAALPAELRHVDFWEFFS